MTEFETVPATLPERRQLPISIWIIPDLLLGFLLTVVLTVVAVAVSIGLRVGAGEVLFDGGGLRYANGAPLNTATDLLTPPLFFASLFMQNLSFTAIVWLRVRKLRKLPWSWLGVQAPKALRLVGLGFGLGIAFLVLNIASSYLFSQILGIQQNQADQFPIKLGDTSGQIMVLLAAMVLAPLGEELLFRGYIFHSLRQDLGRPAAYIGSALLFSGVHIFGVTQGAVALLIPLFFGGLLLAWATDRTESLVPSIIAHAMNNGVAMAALLFCTNYAALCKAT
jgi:membrane protease YdiL (CAAX protease family)